MKVTVSFEFEADVYDDKDMYQLAQEEEDYIEEELYALLEQIVSQASKVKVKVVPKLA